MISEMDNKKNEFDSIVINEKPNNEFKNQNYIQTYRESKSNSFEIKELDNKTFRNKDKSINLMIDSTTDTN